MKQICLILIAVFFCSLGCEQNKVVEKTVVVTAQQQDTEGGADVGGGGNGIDGIPLEAFKVNISKTSLYKFQIDPLVGRLIQIQPSLASGFYRIANYRGWYFVPVSLNKIPSIVIGAPFVTDQLAFQTLFKVWVDQNLYEKMNEEHQKTLLIHELVMGTRLLSYRKNYEKCFAFIDQFLLQNQMISTEYYEFLKSQCRQFDPSENTELKSIELKPQDYDNIQELTALIVKTNLENLSEEELDKMQLYLKAGRILEYTNIQEYLKMVPDPKP